MDAVRELRRRKGWSQQDLASASGVGQDTISSLELGRHEPRPSTLRKIAAAFGVEVTDLFGEGDSPKAAAPPLLAEFLEERCGHAYLARSKDGVEALINDADPLLVDGIMDQIRQEITVLGEERKKYPVAGRWRWDESFTDLMSKYLLAGFAATERSPARREAALRMARELEHPPTENSDTA